ncbi:DUF2185 domain-containing protein [Mucilaginibacter sp. AW1-3]
MGFWPFGKSKTQAVKKFNEPLSTAVLTTKFVINEGKEITYVTHDAEDGGWQFLSDDVFDDYKAVIMVVGLGQIIERDQTISDLADLPPGYYAVRDKQGDAWVINKSEEE